MGQYSKIVLAHSRTNKVKGHSPPPESQCFAFLKITFSRSTVFENLYISFKFEHFRENLDIMMPHDASRKYRISPRISLNHIWVLRTFGEGIGELIGEGGEGEEGVMCGEIRYLGIIVS